MHEQKDGPSSVRPFIIPATSPHPRMRFSSDAQRHLSRPHSLLRPGLIRQPRHGPRRLSTILKLVCVRTIHRDNSARAIILKLDCNLKPSHPVAASIRLPPIFYSLACHRRPASLVPRRADPRRRPLDRSANHRSAHPAPLSGLDSPRALSRTLQIHSTEPNLTRPPARRNRRRRRALLPAPWIRLARDRNRRPGRFRR
jgi:hypothetical protein